MTLEPWNFDDTGVEDITTKFQELVDATIPRKFPTTPDRYAPYILYFPNGTYRLSDSIIGAIQDGGASAGGFVIQGESMEGVVLKLDDNAIGFDASKILISFLEGNATNNAFYNHVENVTIDTGSGNPGAIGMRFHANNTGVMRNVTIRSGDGSGETGLLMDKGTTGPLLLSNLYIDGFNRGIRLGGGGANRHGIVVRGLTLQNQLSEAILLTDLVLTAQGVVSQNDVPFLRCTNGNALVTLIDSQLYTAAESVDKTAILRAGSRISLRGVDVGGYSAVVESQGSTELVDIGIEEEWHSNTINYLWENSPRKTLDLPIAAVPEADFLAPSEWEILTPSGGDDTEAIRRAMATGKPGVFLRPGQYRISDTIRIATSLKWFAGQYAALRLDTPLYGNGEPVFEVGQSDYDVVILERLRGNFSASGNPNPLILNGSTSALYLRDLFWVNGPVYRSEPSTGKVFVENVHSLPGTQANKLGIPAYVIRGQEFHAWQFNPEQLFPHALVENAEVVLFGGKFGETRGPIVEALEHAEVEALGFVMNVTHDTLDIDPADTVILDITDSNVVASFIEQAQLSGGGRGWGRHNYVAIERRNGEERRLVTDDSSVAHRTGLSPQYGAFVNLYTGVAEGYPDDLNVPTIIGFRGNRSENGRTWKLYTALEDTAEGELGAPRVHWRQKNGPDLVRFATDTGGMFTSATFGSEGVYTLAAVVSDGLGKSMRDFQLRVLPTSYEFFPRRADAKRYVDNAPQDGVPDLLQIVFLQAGADSSNNVADVKVEIPLAEIKSGIHRMRDATYRFNVAEISNASVLDVEAAYADSFGICDPEDFSAPREPVATIDVSAVAVDDYIEVDVRDKLVEAIDNGADYLSLWFSLKTTADGVAETIRFSSSLDSDPAKLPVMRVAFLPATLDELSFALGDLWRWHPAFGYYYRSGDWFYLPESGWLYDNVDGNNSSGMFVYHPDNGWFYYSDVYHPWSYSYSGSGWVIAPSAL